MSDLVFKGLAFKLFEYRSEFYVVRELTGQERDAFLSSMKKKVDTRDPSKPQIKDHTGLNSLLLSFAAEKVVSVKGLSELPPKLEKLEDFVEKESLTYEDFVCESVTHEAVQVWGSGMVGSLTPIAQELSGLNVKKDDQKKE